MLVPESKRRHGGGDCAQPPYEHPVVQEYIGKGRYLQLAQVSRSFLDLYTSKFGSSTSWYLSHDAARYGHLSVLEWGRDEGCCWDPILWFKAAEGGNVDCLEFLDRNDCPRLLMPLESLDEYKKLGGVTCLAGAGGHLSALRWLREHYFPWSDDLCTTISEGGHLTTLEYAYEAGAPWDEKAVCKAAARNGHCHILQWAQERGTVFDGDVCEAAARGAHIHVLQWLRSHNAPWTRETCWAAIQGEANLAEDGEVKLAQEPAEKTSPRAALNALKWCISNGCPWNVNAVLDNQSTALHVATAVGNTEIVVYLLETGASLLPPDAFEFTPLFTGIVGGHLDVVKILVMNAGCPVNNTIWNGSTPLFLASEYGCTEIVKYLLSLGAGVDIAREDQCTPCFISSQNGRYEVVIELIKAGAGVNISNAHGVTPLIVATQDGHLEVCKVLIEAGANVNLCDTSGGSAISVGAECGHVDCVRYLISVGADVNIADADGITPLAAARREKHWEVADMLVAAGAV